MFPVWPCLEQFLFCKHGPEQLIFCGEFSMFTDRSEWASKTLNQTSFIFPFLSPRCHTSTFANPDALHWYINCHKHRLWDELRTRCYFSIMHQLENSRCIIRVALHFAVHRCELGNLQCPDLECSNHRGQTQCCLFGWSGWNNQQPTRLYPRSQTTAHTTYRTEDRNRGREIKNNGGPQREKIIEEKREGRKSVYTYKGFNDMMGLKYFDN